MGQLRVKVSVCPSVQDAGSGVPAWMLGNDLMATSSKCVSPLEPGETEKLITRSIITVRKTRLPAAAKLALAVTLIVSVIAEPSLLHALSMLMLKGEVIACALLMCVPLRFPGWLLTQPNTVRFWPSNFPCGAEFIP